jgi:hypothetical protein
MRKQIMGVVQVSAGVSFLAGWMLGLASVGTYHGAWVLLVIFGPMLLGGALIGCGAYDLKEAKP